MYAFSAWTKRGTKQARKKTARKKAMMQEGSQDKSFGSSSQSLRLLIHGDYLLGWSLVGASSKSTHHRILLLPSSFGSRIEGGTGCSASTPPTTLRSVRTSRDRGHCSRLRRCGRCIFQGRSCATYTPLMKYSQTMDTVA